jgi:hypothetical protein
VQGAFFRVSRGNPKLGYIVTGRRNFLGQQELPRGFKESGDPLMAVWDSAERRIPTPRSQSWLGEALSLLDARLRRRQEVFEYSSNPACVFRVDISPAARPLILRDGTRVGAGQRIARLHFWIEQVPPMPKSGATIAWARQMQRAMALSLRELAAFLAARPELDDVTVVCAEAPSGTKTQSEQLGRIMARYGFEAVIESGRLPLGERLHRLGENILISMVILAHNPAALRPDTLWRVRLPIYLSRRVLEKEFG